MATTGLDFTKITPPNGAVQSLKQLIFLSTFSYEKYGKYVNFMPRVFTGDKAAFVGSFGNVGSACTGCKPEYEKAFIDMSEKTWEINCWQIALEMCYDELMGTIAQYALKEHTSVDDLTGTEYLDIIEPKLTEAVQRLLWRLVWFGDKSNSDKQLSITDGLFKRIKDIAASNAERQVVIEANSKTTKAEQKAAFNADGVAIKAFDDLISNASAKLKGNGAQTIYMTELTKEALNYDLQRKGSGCCLAWQSLFSGITETQYQGRTLVAIPEWDIIIEEHSEGKPALIEPFRMVYTVKDNLLVGSNSSNEIAEISMHFDEKDRTNYIFAKDTIGTLIAQDNLVQIAI